MDMETGQIVASRTGRDVTRWYVVLGSEGGRILLADGERRTLAAPKRKNPRHLAPTRTVLGAEQIKDDITIRKVLKAFADERQHGAQFAPQPPGRSSAGAAETGHSSRKEE